MKLNNISLIDFDEVKAIKEFNKTNSIYPKDKNIIDIFMVQIGKYPDNTAVVFEDTELSYRELDERSNQLARYILSLGIIKGQHNPLIAICVERSIEMIVGLLGILKAGGAYVPLDPEYPQERLAYMLEDSDVKLLLTQESLSDQLPKDTRTVVYLDTDWKTIGRRSKTSLKQAIDPRDLAYVIYTSGSTGKPKGVMVEHKSVNKLVFNIDYCALNNKTIILQLASLSFDAATFEIWGGLLHGGTIVCFPYKLPSAKKLKETLEDHNINTLFLTSGLFNTYINESPLVFESLDFLLTGGERMSVRHVKNAIENLPSLQLVNVYGPTENTTFSTYFNLSNNRLNFDLSVPIGVPISNTQVYILDKNNQISPIGVVGELCIAGAGLARGYLNNPELTAEKFIFLGIHPKILETCPEEEIESKEGFVRIRLYRTGDLGSWLPDGNIEYLGRMDFQVKLRGYRIELGEIENRLLEHADIREAVVGVTGEDEHKQLVAWVVTNDDAKEPDAEQLRPYLKETLPDYMVPAFYVPLGVLPLTPNGKIDRKALPAPDRELFIKSYVVPETSTEKKLATIWEGLLKQEKIGRTDNFFDRGGYSLLLVSMVKKLNKTYSIELDTRDIYKSPILKDVSLLIDNYTEVDYYSGNKSALSISQRKYWFYQYESKISGFFSPLIISIKINKNPSQIYIRLKRIIEKLDVFNMRFHVKSGVPFQTVNYESPPRIKMVNNIKANYSKHFIKSCGLEKSGYNLLKGKRPYDISIYETSGYAYVYMAIDHILYDQYSLTLLMNLFLGQMKVTEITSFIKEVSIEGNRINNKSHRINNYWKDKYTSINSDLFDIRGGGVDIKIDTTLFTLKKNSLNDCFFYVLHSLVMFLREASGEEIIAIGVRVNNRNTEGSKKCLGFLSRTLTYVLDSGTSSIDDVKREYYTMLSNSDIDDFYLINSLLGAPYNYVNATLNYEQKNEYINTDGKTVNIVIHDLLYGYNNKSPDYFSIAVTEYKDSLVIRIEKSKQLHIEIKSFISLIKALINED